ncbi:MAG: lipoprotein [Pseudomonadota bacterium]
MIVLAIAVALSTTACGKRGPLSFPPGTDSLPPDPSKRDDPPA